MAATAALTKEATALRESLQVAPPSDIVEWINALFYADPGVGKTYLTGTADDSELTRPMLLFDVEGGVTTIRHKSGIDVVRVRSMKELTDNYNKLYTSIKNGKIYYKTVGIDSLSELTDLDMRYIMEEAWGKNPDKVDKDVPSQREWGKARVHMRRIVRAFRDLPCNVIFTAQVATLQEEGQPTKFFPGFSGKLRTEIPGFMDIVGYMYAENNQGVIDRKIQFQGTRRVVAKDRTATLGDVLTNTSLPEIWELIHSAGKVNNKTPAKK
jgi:phage nucleotide-binding protein